MEAPNQNIGYIDASDFFFSFFLNPRMRLKNPSNFLIVNASSCHVEEEAGYEIMPPVSEVNTVDEQPEIVSYRALDAGGQIGERDAHARGPRLKSIPVCRIGGMGQDVSILRGELPLAFACGKKLLLFR